MQDDLRLELPRDFPGLWIVVDPDVQPHLGTCVLQSCFRHSFDKCKCSGIIPDMTFFVLLSLGTVFQRAALCLLERTTWRRYT